MINIIFYTIVLTLYFSKYLAGEFEMMPRFFTWLPEIISIFILMIVVLRASIFKSIKIHKFYYIWFLFIIIHILIGVFVNQVTPGAVIAGLRQYFKYIPIFLLPAVFTIKEKQLTQQLVFLLVMAIAQFPLAMYQKFVQYTDWVSGDIISGTFTAAPVLSIHLCCASSILMGFYLKGKIKTITLFTLLSLFVIPMMLNETKGTLILFPIALFLPILFVKKDWSKLKPLFITVVLFIFFVGTFNIAYSFFFSKRTGVLDFYLSGEVSEYLYKKADEGRLLGQESDMGRIDAIIFAMTERENDLHTIFGVGIGNASVSFSDKFEGEYTDDYMRLGGKKNGISHLLWEIGLLGVIIGFPLFYLFFSDAVRVKELDTISGALALGLIGVVGILVVALPYQNIITQQTTNYLFLYLAGYTASKRIMMAGEIEKYE